MFDEKAQPPLALLKPLLRRLFLGDVAQRAGIPHRLVAVELDAGL